MRFGSATKAGRYMVEATVVAWRKSPGERVEQGEPIIEIEIEAPVAGVLREVLVGLDEDAPIGATLGLIEPLA